MAVKTRRVEYSESTREALVASARRLFGSKGYGDAAVEEICVDARLTKGALYHHFRNKRALFEAVFEEIEREAMERVTRAVAGAEDPWTGAIAGVRAFLDACMEPDFQRLALREGPAVLGIERVREIDARYSAGLVHAALSALMEAGLLAPRSVDLVVRVVLGAVNEAAQAIAEAEDAARMRREAEEILVRLLESLRPTGE
ncbi:MAG: TetR/AcrR family transcriptional regulator [Myxococcales bacterium]|nr:TetR/AcrR family transcriptional regulator [Myxococcales bacterium]